MISCCWVIMNISEVPWHHHNVVLYSCEVVNHQISLILRHSARFTDISPVQHPLLLHALLWNVEVNNLWWSHSVFNNIPPEHTCWTSPARRDTRTDSTQTRQPSDHISLASQFQGVLTHQPIRGEDCEHFHQSEVAACGGMRWRLKLCVIVQGHMLGWSRLLLTLVFSSRTYEAITDWAVTFHRRCWEWARIGIICWFYSCCWCPTNRKIFDI